MPCLLSADDQIVQSSSDYYPPIGCAEREREREREREKFIDNQ